MSSKISIKKRLFTVFNVAVRVCIVISMVLSSLALQTKNVYARSKEGVVESGVPLVEKDDIDNKPQNSASLDNESEYIPPVYKHKVGITNSFKNEAYDTEESPTKLVSNQFWLGDPIYVSGEGGYPYGSISHPDTLVVPAGQKAVGLIFRTTHNTYGSVSLRGSPFGALNGPLPYSGAYCRAERFQEYWAGPWHEAADICDTFNYTLAGPFSVSQFGLGGPVSTSTEDWYQWSTSGSWSAEIRYIYWGIPIDSMYRMNLSGDDLKNGTADSRECPIKDCEDNDDSVGDPVNTYTGAADFGFEDLTMQTDIGAFSFQRSYSSIGVNLYDQTLGYGWTHNHDIKLIFPDGEDGEDGLVWFKATTANQYKFVINSDGTFTAGNGVYASLIFNNDHYELTDSGQNVYIFNNEGKITSWSDALGKQLIYEYSNGLLNKVSANNGARYYDLTYDAQNRISQVSDHTGRLVSYGYDADGDLVSFTDGNGETWEYEYDKAHQMTRYISPTDQTIVENIYNRNGQIIEQYDGEDNQQFAITYKAFGTREVTYPNNAKTTVEYDGSGKVISRTDPYDGVISYINDDNFHITSETDQVGDQIQKTWSVDGQNLLSVSDSEGNQIEYTYDSLGNIISIENARGFITTFTYNGMLMTSSTDTLGNDTFYTYDANNHLASMTDPLNNISYFNFDTQGQLISSTDAAGNITNYLYDGLGRVTDISNPDGVITHYRYDSLGNVLQVIENYDENYTQNELNIYNITTDYSYDYFGNILTITDTYGNVTQNEYDGNQRIISTTDPAGHITTYTYDWAGNQLSETNALNKVTTMEYDLSNRLSIVTNPDNHSIHYTYNLDSTLASISDPLGRETHFEYDHLKRTTTIEDVLGNQLAFEYDEMGNVISMTDPEGNVTEFSYDAMNNVIQTIDNENGVSERYYDENGNLIQNIDARGNATTYTYNALNQIEKITDALGNETNFSYNNLGQIVNQIDANGHSVTVQYDDLGRQVALINHLNQSLVVNYDALSQISSYQDELGRTWHYGYDALGQLIQSVDPMDGVTSYSFDAMGNLLTENDVNGHTTTYTYDDLNRILSVTDANNHTVSSTYDAAGNMINVTDAAGNETTYGYDALNRQVSITNAEEKTSRMSYDSVGNMVSTTDANGIVTYYEYDGLNHLVKVIENYVSGALSTSDRNVSTEYVYDENGNLLTATDANGHIDTYTYNVLNQLASKSDALGNINSYFYDGVGNLTQVIDANSHSIRYEYDELNRLVLIDYPDPDADVTYTYDAAGQIDSMSDGLGVTGWDYDDLGRPISITDPNNATVSYAYDAIGNRTGMEYPDGKSISYTYDPANRLTAVVDWNHSETQYHYNAANYLERVDLPNGVFSEYEYDSIGRITSLSHQTNTDLLSTYLYTYDNVGNLVNLQELFGETIFEDGFESQDLSKWGAYTDNADLSVSTMDPIYQNNSLQISINDNDQLYVRDDSPVLETNYNARFYFTPYYLNMSGDEQMDLFAGKDGEENNLFGVRLGYDDNKFQIKSFVYDENQVLHESDWSPIGRSVNSIELGWRAASSDTTPDGELQLWINNVLINEMDNLDSDTQHVESALMGVMNIQGENLTGDILFDEFNSSKQGFIGIDTAVELGKKPDLIFNEDFEDGNTSSWTSFGEANLTVNGSSAIEGDYGLEVSVDNTTETYLTRQTPDEEKEYYSRFYFDPNSIDLSAESIGIFGLYTLDSQQIGLLSLSEDDGVFKLQSQIRDNNQAITESASVTIGDFVHAVEVYWKTSTSSIEPDGQFTIWIDGIESITLTNLNSDQLAIGNIKLGAGISDAIESTASGSLYFDGFEDHRQTRIVNNEALLNPVIGVGAPILWLDASQMYGYNDGDVVTQWEDISRNQNEAGQTITGLKPEFSSNEVNGNPAILFDGVDDYLDLTNLYMDSDTTIIVVAENETQSSGNSIHRPILAGIYDPYLVSGTQYALGYKSAGNEGYAACLSDGIGTAADCIFTNRASNADYEIHELRNTNMDMELFRNGEFVGSDHVLRITDFQSGYRVGVELSDSTQVYQGGVAEIIVYDRALTDEELDKVDLYLANKYGLTHFVPTATPTATATNTPLAPMQVSGAVLWLDAAQIYGHSDGDTISNWADLSGNGNDAMQITGVSQPIYTTNEISGKPAIVFDGSNDFLNLSDLYIGSDTTVIIVAENKLQDTSGSIFKSLLAGSEVNPYTAGSTQYAFAYGAGSAYYGFSTYLNYPENISTTTGPNGLYEYHEFRKSGTEAELFRDGYIVAEGTLSMTSGFDTGYTLGTELVYGTRYYNGGIAEVIVYNRALSDVELEQLEDYLSNKYDITKVEATFTPTPTNTNTPTSTRTPGPTLPPMQVSGAVLWLDAAQMYGYTNGDAVSYWEDLSGSDNNAEQTTTSSQPIYVENKINGKPAIVFDGSNDYLNLSDLYIGSDTTVIIVAENKTQSTSGSIFKSILAGSTVNPYTTGSTQYAFAYGSRSGYYGFSSYLNYPENISTTTGPNDAYEYHEFRKSGTEAELYRDGYIVAEGTLSRTSGFDTGYTLGTELVYGTRYYNGGIAEVIVYDRALSDIELEQLEDYLSNKYDITKVEATLTPTPTNTSSPTATRTPGPTLPPMQVSGAVLWLDAAQMYGYSNGDTVSNWEDLSGNGNDAEQGSSTLQPIYTTNEINGNPAIVFDGSNDYLNLSDLYIGSDTTVIIVAENKIQSTSGSIFKSILAGSAADPYTTGSTQYAFAYGSRSGYYGFSSYLNYPQNISTTTAPNGLYEYHEFRKSGTEAELYRDGYIVAEGTLTRTSGFTTGYTLGTELVYGTRYYNGGIAEVIVYDRALSDTELEQLEDYLSNKYGITKVGATLTPTLTGTSTPSETQIPTNIYTPSATRTPGSTLSPMQISDAILWLDVSQMYGYSDGDAISNWEDMSGNNNNAIQSSSSFQPIYTENEINSNPALMFDGSDDYLNLSDLYIDSDTTVFIIAENETQTSNTESIHRPILAGSDGDPYIGGGTQYGFGYKRSGVAGYIASIANGSIEQPISTSISANGEYELHEYRKSGTSAQLYRDGIIVSSGTCSRTTGFGTGYKIGAELTYSARRYKGGVAEIIVYNRALSDSEIDQIESYIRDKYAIDVYQPTSTSTVTSVSTNTGTSTSTHTLTPTSTPSPLSTSTSTATTTQTPAPTDTETATETAEGTLSGNVIDSSEIDYIQYANPSGFDSSMKSLHVMAKLDTELGNFSDLEEINDRIAELRWLANHPDAVQDQKITYTYDALNRLTRADYHDGTYFNYSYDAVGNILSQETQDGTSTYTYDAADRISSLVNNSGTFSYSWDGNGNLLSDGTASYTYNTANRMTGLTKGSDVYTYAYNGLGDRYAQTVNGVSTTYQLDLAANLVQVLNDGDNTYLYGLDRIAQVSATQTGYFLPDALGSVRQVVDPQAQLQLAHSYTPFGEELSSSGEFETTFGFAGEQQDASGLLYLRARYLSTSTGRFTSVDPFSGYLNYPASMNPYQYAYNNPLRYVDPSGKVAFLALLGLSTVGGAAIGAGGSIISQLIANGGNWNCIDWGEVGKAAIVGAIGGALGFLAVTVIAATGGGVALTLGLTVLFDVGIGEVTYAADQKLHGEEYEFSWQRIATNAVISAVTFGAGYGIGKIWNNSKEGIIFEIQNKLRKLGRSEEFITNFSKFLNGPVVEFEGRKVFTNPDLFDWDHEISNGITNTTRSAKSGLAPVDNEGGYMVLHHIFQKEPGPMVILPETYHGYKPNKANLHGLIPDGSSFRRNATLNNSYETFKKHFWKWFANNH